MQPLKNRRFKSTKSTECDLIWNEKKKLNVLYVILKEDFNFQQENSTCVMIRAFLDWEIRLNSYKVAFLK